MHMDKNTIVPTGSTRGMLLTRMAVNYQARTIELSLGCRSRRNQ